MVLLRITRVMKMAFVLCVLLMISSVVSFDSGHLYSFKNTEDRSRVSSNSEKVDHIFNLLADIDYDNQHSTQMMKMTRNRNDYQSIDEEIHQQTSFQPTNTHYDEQINQTPMKNQDSSSFSSNKSTESDVNLNKINNKDTRNEDNLKIIQKYTPSALKSYLRLASAVSKNSIIGTGVFDEVFQTVGKVTQMYDDALEKEIQKSSTKSIKMNNNTQAGLVTSTSQVIKTLLKPENALRIYDISTKADTEDEILQELVSVILGVESRTGHGSSLTFDPVTIIALLTLAAYLIRAAYQFLVAANARSMNNNYNFPFDFTALPEAFVAIQDMLHRAQIRYDKEEDDFDFVNSVEKSSSLTPWAIDTFSLINLYREGNKPCFRKYLCQRVTGKSIWNFGIPEIIWTTIGIYDGDKDILQHLNDKNAITDGFCDNFSTSFCQKKKKNNQENNHDNCQKCPQNIDYDMTKVNKFLTILTSRNSYFYPWYQEWSLV